MTAQNFRLSSYVDTGIKKLYVPDLPQKSPLCSDELLGGPILAQKTFLLPRTHYQRLYFINEEIIKNPHVNTFERY